jgi:5-methylcytosine-specific restriction protein A
MSKHEMYRNWYGQRDWKELRARFLFKNQHCVYCAKVGVMTRATICDHIKPHRGNRELFLAWDNLQALCKPCHDGAKAAYERSGRVRKAVGLDGWSIE